MYIFPLSNLQILLFLLYFTAQWLVIVAAFSMFHCLVTYKDGYFYLFNCLVTYKDGYFYLFNCFVTYKDDYFYLFNCFVTYNYCHCVYFLVYLRV